MKIYINNANENWIVDRLKEQWYQYFPDTIPKDLNDLDVFWLLAPWQWRELESVLETKVVVCTIHHVDENKFNEQEFKQRDKYVDYYHVPNKFTHEFIADYTKKPIVQIGYWFVSDIWYNDEKDYRGQFDLKENDYVIGSFQRDTEGHDLKSPKLCKGPDVFCDYVEAIKKIPNLVVLLGGWRRQYVIKRLTDAGIDFRYKELPDQETIRRMYQCCNLYVVGSRTEGGPQALFEASNMKIPIISTDCGMASQVLSEKCIFDMGVNNKYWPSQEDIEFNFNNVKQFDIKDHGENYIHFFEEIT